MHINRLGIDIGGVILKDDLHDTSKSMFGSLYLQTPEVEGAIDSIGSQQASNKWKDIYLISKSTPATQARMRAWLYGHNFFKRTGLTPDKIHFCVNHEDKGRLAAQLLLTHFIDDRTKVMDALQSVPHRILFDPKQIDRNIILGNMVVASDWSEVNKLLDTNVPPTTRVVR